MWFKDEANGARKTTNKKAIVYFHGSETDSTLAAQYGSLKFNNSERFTWNNDGGLLKYGGATLGEWTSTGGALKYSGNDRLTWDTDGGELKHTSTSLLKWTSSQINVYKPVYIFDDAKATSNSHAIHKGYVDDKIQELLDRIAELEMAGGGGTENYRLKMETKSFYSSTSVGNTMSPNSIATVNELSSSNPWANISFRAFDGSQQYCFVCFPDDTYSLTSTGTLYLARESRSSSAAYDNEDHAIKFVVSEAVKCPDEHSNGENIWRCTIQPDLYRITYTTTGFGSYNDNDQIYITFGGGSLIKTSTL